MLEKDDIIGGYTLKQFLGRGQFGEVWLGEKQLQFSTRNVRHALKFLFNKSGELNIKAVEAEIDTWIEASGHPNVMSVLDMLIHKENVVIISEYAEGGSLHSWMQKNGGKAPSNRKALEIMLDILRGIEHLHSRNVVHRDLKPDNILIQGTLPRITDFGISRIVSANTKATMPVGSPVYMSPESFEGSKSPQIDIWSAGIILYELLSGKTPYFGKLGEIKDAIRNAPLPPLPDEIPQQIKAVIFKALEKNPKQRFQNAKEMRLALEKSLYNLGEKNETEEYLPTDSQENILTLTELNSTNQSERTLTSAMKRKRSLVWTAGGIGLLGVLLAVGFWSTTNIFNRENANPANQESVLPINLSSEIQKNELPAAPKIELVEIKPGTFMMGSNNGEADEKPVHLVQISYGFYIGKYEITQKQWETVMGNNPSFFKGDNLPVENIDWNDAKEFIRRLNEMQSEYEYRLPTEAEWEYACRSGTTTNFAFSDSLSSGQANIDGNEPFGNALKGMFLQRTSEVGNYSPNNWGLYDMHGNVWEWVEDISSLNYNGLAADGSANLKVGDLKQRGLRGGSWKYGGKVARSANRGAIEPLDKSGGIRVVARLK